MYEKNPYTNGKLNLLKNVPHEEFEWVVTSFAKTKCLLIQMAKRHMKKMFNIVNYRRNANKNYNEVSSHWSEWISSKNLQIMNAGEGVEKKEP